MKIAATTLCLCWAPVGPAAAFVAAPGAVVAPAGRRTSRHMAESDDEIKLTINQAKAIRGTSDDAPARRAPAMSQALPFAKCPRTLDGALAADYGFDPLGFADSYENLAKYREAEVKHGRLAMLAAAGWPLSELWDGKIAGALGLEPALNPDGRVPSVLNGGMGRVSVAYWIGVVWLAAALDVYGAFFASKKDGYTAAGDFGLRGFYPETEKGRTRMRVSEIKHGRLAMVAITAYAAQEFVSHVPVVDHASLFFRPITDVLGGAGPAYDYVPAEAVTEAITAVAPEAVVPAAAEAAASVAVPPVSATGATVQSAMEALSAASGEATAAAPVEAVAAPAGVPPVEELGAAKDRIVELQAQIASKEELVEARNKIVDLEAKLAQIQTLVR